MLAKHFLFTLAKTMMPFLYFYWFPLVFTKYRTGEESKTQNKYTFHSIISYMNVREKPSKHITLIF